MASEARLPPGSERSEGCLVPTWKLPVLKEVHGASKVFFHPRLACLSPPKFLWWRQPAIQFPLALREDFLQTALALHPCAVPPKKVLEKGRVKKRNGTVESNRKSGKGKRKWTTEEAISGRVDLAQEGKLGSFLWRKGNIRRWRAKKPGMN